MIDCQKIKALAEQQLVGTDVFVVSCKVSPFNEVELLLDSDTSVQLETCAAVNRAVKTMMQEVADSGDVDTVKGIFQDRIDAQVSGGAWYPSAIEAWQNNSRVVSKGSYVMMVVHEDCDAIVNEFNALF